MTAAMKTGVIEKIDQDSKSGFIVSDEDQKLVYFSFDDVLKDVGLGAAQVGQLVQFSQDDDPEKQAVAKRVVVMAVKAYRARK